MKRVMGFTLAAVVLVTLTVSAWWVVERSRQPQVDFREYAAGQERKEAFIEYLLPIVRQENAAILSLRQLLATIPQEGAESGWAREFVFDAAERYGMEEFDFDRPDHWRQLMRRIDVIPASMVLAQAAAESGWGTSRFAREGSNLFGQWCYQEGCGIVPARRDAGANHEVAAFDSPRESVRRYLHNLNTHSAYRDLRKLRAERRVAGAKLSGLRFVEELSHYSSRRQEYVNDLVDIIRVNRFERFDRPPQGVAAGRSQ